MVNLKPCLHDRNIIVFGSQGIADIHLTILQMWNIMREIKELREQFRSLAHVQPINVDMSAWRQ